MEDSAARSARPCRGLAGALHIFGLFNLAVAEPLFDLMSRQVEFLIAHQVQPLDLVLVALLLSVGLPACFVALIRSIAWPLPPVGKWAHLALVAGLAGLIPLQLVKRLAPAISGELLVAAAVALAVATGICYFRWSGVRTFCTFIAPVALLSPLLFLFTSPVRQILLHPTVDWRTQRAPMAGEEGGRATNAPVIMVVLDELPLSSLLDEADEIDPLRYPNLAALADDGYWFRDATTVAVSTVHSVPIMLSGRVPDRALPPLTENYPDNLFTWLASAGYRLNVAEVGTRLCPPELCSDAGSRRSFAERFDALASDLSVIYLHLLLPADLADELPAIDVTWRDFAERTIGTRLRGVGGESRAAPIPKDRDEPARFASFLESLEEGPSAEAVGREDSRVLHYFHLLLPHIPWRYLPSGKRYGPTSISPHGLSKDRWGREPWPVIQGLQRHLLQLGLVDSLIGQLLAQLKQQGLYDSALIIVVADHGAAFRPGSPRRRLAAENFADILNVPLIVKLPGQRQGVRSDRNVETVDILPTIADALGLALPWPVDGGSAIDSEQPERPEKLTVTGNDRFLRQQWDIATLRAERRRSVADKLRVFGSGHRPGGLMNIGRRTDLWGRRTSDIGVVPAANEPGTEIVLHHASSYREVDPDSPILPAYVSGQARFARSRYTPVELAVAVNGTVEALTQTFSNVGRRGLFIAMVREEAFVAGRNHVEVFEIQDRQKPVLVASRQQDYAEFALVGVPGEEAIRSADGKEIPLVAGHLRGVAKLRRGALNSWLAGWAQARVGGKPAQTLLVFVEGRLVAATPSGLAPRTRRVTARKPRAASFRIRLPNSPIADATEIRLFAILDETASEIRVKRMPATS